ncbi:HPr kinase/phosphorylase [Lachnospiraceae bacterium TWA4]|nr:HPr kinase/phosphorylase [Lachnospiraceae bacterium TWA4]
MLGVRVSTFIDKMKLKNLTETIDTSQIIIKHADVNRPALQLTGHFAHFNNERVQLIGNVEEEYLHQMPEEQKIEIYDKLFSYKFPCLILCRGYYPDKYMYDAAVKYDVPLLMTDKTTSDMLAEVIIWLKTQLAPMISIHGVLVDVFGEGVLITGESGIGKSEVALELIKRGHRLVSDDVVEIRKVSDDELVGSAPAVTRHFIELRGIGIIDAKTLFGVESVKDSQKIDMTIHLEEWRKDKEFDRLGKENQYEEYLNSKVVCHRLPVRPGRNVAIIVETAAINHRQKKMGYNATDELYRRVQENLTKGVIEDII